MRNSDSPTKRSVETIDVIAYVILVMRENDYGQIPLLANSSPITFPAILANSTPPLSLLPNSITCKFHVIQLHVPVLANSNVLLLLPNSITYKFSVPPALILFPSKSVSSIPARGSGERCLVPPVRSISLSPVSQLTAAVLPLLSLHSLLH